MNGAAARVFAVVPAAGIGRRMGAGIPKQYLEIDGRAVLVHTLDRLARHPAIARIVVAIAPDDDHFDSLRAALPARCDSVAGGAERCHSVLAGLERLAADGAAEDDWALVHDAARPCVRVEDIDAMLDSLSGSAVGGILGTPVRDTLKRCDAAGVVSATVDRSGLWHALTPQLFRLGLLRAAIADALAAGLIVTDEAQAVERAGHRLTVVPGHADNIKVTQPEDLALAGRILAAQQENGT
ncbi:MAG: 2-C-methyl-D-erythritol 4-phosphate cytidylyltransferase [Gammaproteobacteria bacterium]